MTYAIAALFAGVAVMVYLDHGAAHPAIAAYPAIFAVVVLAIALHGRRSGR